MAGEYRHAGKKALEFKRPVWARSQNLEELVGRGLISTVPKDPFGGGYYWDKETGRVQSGFDPSGPKRPASGSSCSSCEKRRFLMYMALNLRKSGTRKIGYTEKPPFLCHCEGRSDRSKLTLKFFFGARNDGFSALTRIGFSLIEVVAAIAILSLLLGGVLAIFSQGFNAAKRTRNQAVAVKLSPGGGGGILKLGGWQT